MLMDSTSNRRPRVSFSVLKRFVLPQFIRVIHLEPYFADLTFVKEFTESAAPAILTAFLIKMIKCKISLWRDFFPSDLLQWKLQVLEDCNYMEQQANVHHRHSDIRDATAPPRKISSHFPHFLVFPHGQVRTQSRTDTTNTPI